jgi:pimeloyl-ACP methyl ester carboxylesterase
MPHAPVEGSGKVRVNPVVGVGAAVVGGLVGGALLGAAAESLVFGTAYRKDPDRNEPFGKLRGHSRTVITEDGVPLYVEVETPARYRPDSDPTIIFTHGYALNQDCWHYQRRDLETLGRLVFWDHRSHGRSGVAPAQSVSIDQLGRDLAAVIAEVAPTGPLILVGHSMGGMTVMAFADQFPEIVADRVVGVALLATSAGELNTVSLGLPAWSAPVLQRYSGAATRALRDGKAIIDPVRSRASDLSFIVTRIYSFGGWSSPSMTRFVNEMVNATPADVIAAFLPTLLEHDKVDALAGFKDIEALVLVGTHDLVTPVAHSKTIAEHIPHAEVVVQPDAGHMVILERHADVNHHLRRLTARAMA